MRGDLLLAMLVATAAVAIMPIAAAAEGDRYGSPTAVLGDTSTRPIAYDIHPNPLPPTTAQRPSQIIANWPTTSRNVARNMINRYGEPTAWSNDMLHWHTAGTWDYIAVHANPIQHNFPFRHQEVLQAGIYMDVPQHQVSALQNIGLHYDPNLRVAFSTSQSEAQSFLAFNIGNEILGGRLTAQQGLDQFNSINDGFITAGTTHPYLTNLTFSPGVVAGVARTAPRKTAAQPYRTMPRRTAYHPHGRVLGATRTRTMARGVCCVWDPCRSRWVTTRCPVGVRPMARTTYRRGDRMAYSPGTPAYYGYDAYGRQILTDDGVVAGFTGVQYGPVRQTWQLDRQRVQEYNQIFGAGWGGTPTWLTGGGYVWVDGQQIWATPADFDWRDNRWVYRPNPNAMLEFDMGDINVGLSPWAASPIWTTGGGYVFVDGQRTWATPGNFMWQNNNWVWRDRPDAVLNFDVGDIGVGVGLDF